METPNRDTGHTSSGSKPDGDAKGTPKRKVEEEARKAKRAAGTEAREKAEAGQERMAGEASAVSDAIDAAASQLDDQDREGLARYARDMSQNLANVAEQMQDRSVDDLANDAKRLARDNPTLFMLGSVAVGFGLSRFFKASAEHGNNGDGKTSHDGKRSAVSPMQQNERNVSASKTPSADPQSHQGRETL